MEALQNRFDSFAKQKRVKNPSKSSYVNAKWPHSSRFLARPDTLAEAGFYFNPSFEDRDNVTCFMCNKQLSEWEETDDPFDIHWEKCGNKCCWASVRCGLKDDIDEHGRFISTDKTRLPTSKQMERLRLQTYTTGDGWIHDQDRNHGATSQKMARAGFVYTPQYPGDDLATCLYCNVSLSGWDAEDDPLEEHRKRETKSRNACPFFSSNTTTAEASKPPSRTQSQSKPPSKSQPQKPARSVSKSHKDFVLPTKTYDGENSASHEESDTPAALTSSTNNKKKGRSTSASRASRASSTAKTSRRKTRSHSQSRGGLKLGDVVEDEEDEEGEKVPTRRSRRPTTIAASVMATPGIPKPRSRSVSRAKSKAVEEDVLEEEEENEEEVAMPAKTPSRSRLKAKVVTRDEEEDAEEVVELKKSTRGRPKAKTKPKPKAAPLEPEPDNGGELAVEEEEQPIANIKPKPVTGRKPSRTKSKPPPRSEEEEEIEIPAPMPAPVKKAEVASSSIASIRPKADTSKAPSSSSQTLPKISAKVQDIEAETKDKDLMIQRPPAVTETDEMNAFASTSESLTPHDQQQIALAPLHIPKRGGKLKEVNDATNKSIKELNSVEGETLKQAKKSAPVDVQSTVQVVTQPLSQASVQEKTKAKGKGKVLEKDKERKSSILKVVEISTDEEGDDDGGNNDAMDVDFGLKSERGRGKAQTEKENISNRHTKGTENIKVVAPPPAVSKPTTSNRPVVKEKQQLEGMVQQTKATTVEKSLRSPTSPSLRFAEPAEDDIEMAEVEIELGSEAGPLPDEPTQQSETTADVLPQTPPRRGPPSAKPQFQLPSEALAGPTHPALTFPALSKLPFTPVDNLTDAELDMTVEEWIRYQMGVEFDKFRRDGERELQKWVGRAQEARAIIEAL